LIIVAIIVCGTWSLLRDSMAMSLDAVPPGIDAAGVASLHDLHIWPMSTMDCWP